MKKVLLLVPLLLGYASSASTFPAFPAYDPFTDASGSGGTSYAAASLLAGQTNAMRQFWFGINTSGGAANAITNTGYALSYNSLAPFSGQPVLLRNVAGPGARAFFSSSPPLSLGSSSYYYSVVIAASNINTLSTTGQRILGFGTQGTLGDQTSQPTQGSFLWMKQVGTSPNFGFQLGLTGSGSPGTPTFDSANTYATGNTYLLVVAVESGDSPRLWLNPDPSTFGAGTEPTPTFTGASGTLALSAFTCVQMFEIASAADNLYLSSFRMGTNWGWVTGGPAVGLQPIASTNCPTGALNLTALAMNNGTANGYRWQFNGVNLTEGPSPSGSGATVSGSGTASLSINGMDTTVAQRDSGSYTVVVTNAYGAVTSAVALVTANSAPVITTQPSPANPRLYAGVSDTLSVAAVGFAPLSYYWYSNSTLVAGVTTSNFTFIAQDNSSFYCVVSNSVGTATSATVALTVVPAPSSPYPAAVLNDHPLSFWPLSELPDNGLGNNGTPAYDYTGGNNGYYTNANLGQAGYGAGLASQYGYSPQTDTNPSAGFGTFAFYDSGVAQISNITFAASQAASFSVEAWANGNNNPQASGATLINKGYGGGGEQFTLDYLSAGWRFYVRNAAGTTTTAASTNTLDANWHHLVGVVDAGHSNLTLYVDGVARAVTAFNPAGGILSSPYPVLIGTRNTGLAAADYTDTFYGNIQNVAVYNSALTAAQVASHYYAAGIGPSVAGVPASTTANEGATLAVSASVAGSPALAAQWFDVTSGPPGTALTGQTNATLLISNISVAAYDGHYLDLQVTNLYGQVTSSLMFIQVLSGPPNSVVITPAALAVYAGSPLPTPFSVTAQGSQPFSYQWSTNGVSVSGATNAVFTNVPSAAGVYTVGCQVTNSHGPAPSATASLTVHARPSDAYALSVLGAGPVAFWRLDEAPNATTAYDYVGGHNATYTSVINGQPGFSPTLIPGETATVFGTNGTTPSLAMEDNNTAAGIPLVDFATQGGNAQFSVEVWVQAPPQNSTDDVLCKGYPNNTQFAIDTGGTGGAYRFVIHSSAGTIFTVNSGSVGPDGKWHQLVGVCDEASNVIRMYADGSLKGSASVAAGSGLLSLSSSYPVLIAAQENQGASSFSCMSNAAISQVAIYAYALPASQVASNYNAGVVVAPTISVVPSGASVMLTYTGTLVSSGTPSGPFTNVVTGAASPYTVPATNSQLYFRARSTP